jgi:hypothetical protein
MRDDLPRYRAIRHALPQGVLPPRTATTPAAWSPVTPLPQASSLVSPAPSGCYTEPAPRTTTRPGWARTPTGTLRVRLRPR